jgi:hypothetical protein
VVVAPEGIVIVLQKVNRRYERSTPVVIAIPPKIVFEIVVHYAHILMGCQSYLILRSLIVFKHKFPWKDGFGF